MSKLSLSNMVKATGLAAIIAAASACGMPGQRVPPAPYIVAPGHANWNLGAGFMNVAGGMPAPNTNGQQKRNEGMVYNLDRKTYLLPADKGPPQGPPYEGAKGFWMKPNESDPYWVWLD